MDVSILRLGVLSLAALGSLSIVGMVIVASCGHEPPPALVTVATTCSGVLAGILINPGTPATHPVRPEK